MEGKIIIPFATSGGSRMGNTYAELKSSCSGAILKEGKLFNANTKEIELQTWSASLEIQE